MEFTTHMFRPLILLAASIPVLAQQYTITTVAGGAPPATPVAATGTSIGLPRKVLLAGSNIYFSAGNSVFKMDSSGTMTLIAGNSRAGFSGDGGPAVNAQLSSPGGLVFDSAGNLYIADTLNNRVRMVNPQGMISTFAGNGGVSVPGFWGDGGNATDAQIHAPVTLGVDSNGNIYIVASGDNSIRMVDVNGIISIFAGQGYKGFYGDTTSTTPGPANQAGLTSPQDMWINKDGTVLIADTGNAAIRKVATDGTISTISGTGATGTKASGDDVATTLTMIAPTGVTQDSSGNVFIAEFGTDRIRKIDTSGKITTAIGDGNPGFVGDGGPPNKVEMNQPTGVAVDSSGNIYFVDSLNYRIRKLAGGNVTTIAGNGQISHSGDGLQGTLAQLNAPQGVAVDSAGNFYIADSANNVVRRVDTKGVITNFAGNGSAGNGGDGGAATGAQLNTPEDLAVDPAGNLYIADSRNNKVRKVAPNGTISTFAGSGTAGSGGDGGAAGSATLNLPFGIAADTAGNIYITEFLGNRVRKVTPDGTISTVAGNGTSGYSGDGGSATAAMLNGPQDVAADSSGNIYIADANNNRVRQVSGGTINTVAGNGLSGYDRDGVQATTTNVGNPVAVAVDTFGNLYIADGSLRVRKVYTSGIITTIAGSGTRGYAGDGGSATNAQLYSPSALAVNSSGNVWLADTNNNAVRVLQPNNAGISVSSVVNAASNQLGAISPGLVVVIYGSGLGPANLVQYQLDANGLIPTTLSGTTVYFNGAAAPILYTSANQVGAVVPFNLDNDTLEQAFVQYQGQTSLPVNVSVAFVTPAIFTLDGSGKGQAAAINNTDGSINGAAHPVKIGGYIQFYITGAGPTNPPAVDGQPNAVPLPIPIVTPVTVTIGGQQVTPQFVGGAPGAVAGITQVNVQVPSGITPGSAVPVVVTVGNSNSQNGVTIAVSN